MLLRLCVLSIFGLCAAAFAESIPGVMEKTYRLRPSKKASSKSVCGTTVTPEVRRNEDGVLVLELSAALGFEWKQFQVPMGEPTHGCRYATTQTIRSDSDSSSLVLESTEECENGKVLAGSQRSELQLKGTQIVYRSTTTSGPARDSYTCVWAAKN